MQHVHEASGRHGQPEALTQERGHFRERHADFFVQARNQRDGARPQVDVGGPHRVRGLQGMAALHAAPALRALPDRHIKAPDDGLDAGEVLLVLRRHVLQHQRPPTPRTCRRKRGVVGRIDLGGNRAPCPAPIPAASPPARPPAAALGPILGERRGLSEPGAPRGREQPCEALVLALQPLVLTSQPVVFTPQPILLAPQLIPLALQLSPLTLRSRRDLPQPRDLRGVLPDSLVTIGGGTRARISHATVMTDSAK